MVIVRGRLKSWMGSCHLLRAGLPERLKSAFVLSRPFCPQNGDFQSVLRFTSTGKGHLRSRLVTPGLIAIPLGLFSLTRCFHFYKSRAAKKKDSTKKKKKKIRRYKRGRPQKKKVPPLVTASISGRRLKTWLIESKIRRAVS